MKDKIKVLIKRPGKDPTMEMIPNTLEALQEIVGGRIETYTFASGQVVICNEEGYIKHLPYSSAIAGIMFRGTLILAGIDGDDFDDAPLTYSEYKRCLPTLWEDIDNGYNED